MVSLAIRGPPESPTNMIINLKELRIYLRTLAGVLARPSSTKHVIGDGPGPVQGVGGAGGVANGVYIHLVQGFGNFIRTSGQSSPSSDCCFLVVIVGSWGWKTDRHYSAGEGDLPGQSDDGKIIIICTTIVLRMRNETARSYLLFSMAMVTSCSPT